MYGDESVKIIDALGGAAFKRATKLKWMEATENGVTLKLPRNQSGANFLEIEKCEDGNYKMTYTQRTATRPDLKGGIWEGSIKLVGIDSGVPIHSLFAAFCSKTGFNSQIYYETKKRMETEHPKRTFNGMYREMGIE